MIHTLFEATNLTGVFRFSKLPPLAIPLLVFTAGCSVADTQTMQSANQVGVVDVRVFFDERCPKYVDKWEVDVQSNPPQRVRWTAYNIYGSSRNKTVEYDIYFDPFVGPPAGIEKKDGVVTSPPIASNVPAGVSYKYTVLAEGCATGLDPLIRVY